MKTYKLSVPEPCTEDWDAMTPDTQGRFCSMCAKSVIDFTGMSDQQISQVVFASKGEICGRFKNEQLERIIIQVPTHVLFSQKHFHKAFLMALLVAMGTTLFSCTDHNGNSKPIDNVVVVDSVPSQKEQNVVITDSVPQDKTAPLKEMPMMLGAVVVEPAEVPFKPLKPIGKVKVTYDSLLPPPNIKQVEAPKIIPDNGSTEN